jgi:hypothetical protein
MSVSGPVEVWVEYRQFYLADPGGAPGPWEHIVEATLTSATGTLTTDPDDDSGEHHLLQSWPSSHVTAVLRQRRRRPVAPRSPPGD